MDRRTEANLEVLERITTSTPMLIDVLPSSKAIPGMRDDMLLHAGPPIELKDIPGPMWGAIMGALLYEGKADTPDNARKLVERGEIALEPCHHHGAVGPMSGITSPSMPVFVVRNTSHGNYAYCNINEGVGRTKTLRFGAFDSDVIKRMIWMDEVLAPALSASLKQLGGIDLKTVMIEALHRGDECHNRNKAGTAIYFARTAIGLAKARVDHVTLSDVLEFIISNDHFFLNLSMVANKAVLDHAHGVKHSSVLTAMTSNGTYFGIRVSGLGPENPPYQWFTHKSPKLKGRYFDNYNHRHASPLMGDSMVAECVGLGGFAMSAAPAITSFVGGTPQWAMRVVKRMSKIAVGKHPDFTVPYMNYQGTPLGIDAFKVVETGILPIINSGIPHKKPGIGQIGAGLVRPPIEVFKAAVEEYRKIYGDT